MQLKDEAALLARAALIDETAELGEDAGLRAQALGNSFEDFALGKEDLLINAALQVQDINGLIRRSSSTMRTCAST
jgi:hypothetical protein